VLRERQKEVRRIYSEEQFAFMLIWMSIFVYAILASLDLGSGFFYLSSFLFRKHESVRKAFISYSSARWESTNTFFIFIIVAGASYFPSMAAILATGWLIPISVILILFMVRAAFLVYSYYTRRKNAIFLTVYTTAGLIILPAMSLIVSGSTLDVTTITTSAATGAYIVNVNYQALFSNPITYLMIVIAFFGQLMVSGTFNLFYDRDRSNTAYYSMVTRIASIITFACLVLEFQLYYPYARYVFRDLLSNIPYIAISGIFFMIYMLMLFRHRYSIRAFAVMLVSIVFGFIGLGLSKFPYIIYPAETAYSTFTDTSSFSVITITFFAALLLLIPSLYFLNYMFRYPSD